MHVYGATKHEIRCCDFGCCGGKAHTPTGLPRRRVAQAATKEAIQRARREGKKETAQ